MDLFGFHKAVYVQPMNKGIKPFVAGAIGIAQSKAVAAILIQVKFHGNFCVVPGFNQPGVAMKEKIVDSNNSKQWRSIFGYINRSHATINWRNKGEINFIGLESSGHRQTCTG